MQGSTPYQKNAEVEGKRYVLDLEFFKSKLYFVTVFIKIFRQHFEGVFSIEYCTCNKALSFLWCTVDPRVIINEKYL